MIEKWTEETSGTWKRSVKLQTSSKADEENKKKAQITSFRNERENIITDLADIKSILREY